MQKNEQIKVGIFLFNEIEVLDFAGPFEVFSLAMHPNTDHKIFDVVTVSQWGEMITARNGLKVQPDYSFANLPNIDILIIPGGYGAREVEINNPVVINWISQMAKDVRILASVCTGAFLLAKAGILDGKKITTHWASLDRLEKEFPSCRVVRDVKFVDEESIITSGGISAGINMSFHLLKKLASIDVAKATAKRMEYDINL